MLLQYQERLFGVSLWGPLPTFTWVCMKDFCSHHSATFLSSAFMVHLLGNLIGPDLIGVIGVGVSLMGILFNLSIFS